jgi:hypothetical protein
MNRDWQWGLSIDPHHTNCLKCIYSVILFSSTHKKNKKTKTKTKKQRHDTKASRLRHYTPTLFKRNTINSQKQDGFMIDNRRRCVPCERCKSCRERRKQYKAIRKSVFWRVVCVSTVVVVSTSRDVECVVKSSSFGSHCKLFHHRNPRTSWKIDEGSPWEKASGLRYVQRSWGIFEWRIWSTVVVQPFHDKRDREKNWNDDVLY